MECYDIPKVFLQRYCFLLSSDALCILIRFYKFYIDNEDKFKDKKEEFEIPFSIFKSQILVSDDNNLIESVWGELTYWELAKRYYKNNVYVLNLSKIHSDNGDDKKGEFSIKIFDKKGKIRRKKNVKIYVDKYIEGVLSRCPKENIVIKLRKLLEGIVEYFNKKDKKIELEELSKLTESLLDANERVLDKVCDVYNNDEKLYGNRHPNYVLGILKNIQEEKRSHSVTQSTDDFKSKNLDKYANVKDESNRNLAIKIATGNIDNSIAYNSYLELKDIKGLKKLYKLGIEILREEKRDIEIFDKYDWLKYE